MRKQTKEAKAQGSLGESSLRPNPFAVANFAIANYKYKVAIGKINSYQPLCVTIKYIRKEVVVFSLKSQHNYCHYEGSEDKTINSNHETIS